MYKRNSKYSKQKNSELEFGTLDALMKHPGEYLTIEGIKAANGCILGSIPSQKMARILSTLSDYGMVRKKKDKTNMTYCALASTDGNTVHTPFETEDSAYGNFTGMATESAAPINWELDAERGEMLY